MTSVPLTKRAGELWQQESISPALTRALRGTVAFIVPLIVAQVFKIPVDISFVAVGAQVVALTDVRGAYRFRFVILLCVTAAITGAALLGTLAAGHFAVSIAAVAALALLAGVARHLSGDYGPGLGIVAALLFIMALAIPSSHHPWWQHAALAGIGGLWGMTLQALLWPFRPQHALRQSVAETWLAVSEVFASLRTSADDLAAKRQEQLAERERALRTAIDRTHAVLVAARTRRNPALIAHLEVLRVEGARLGNRAAALHDSIDLLSINADYARIAPAIDSLLLALTNLTRSVAITVVSHRPAHFVATEVRINRCLHLIEGVGDHARALPDGRTALLQETLRQIHALLSELKSSLHDTVDRGSSRESFPLRLPELSAWSPRALMSWLTPPSKPDPLIVRHTLRMAVMTMGAIALYEGLGIPRGYWIAFTLIVVLQPDYGATRQKAGQRILGTLAGSALASAFLWLRMPLPVLDVLIAVTVFGFAYYQKQRYALAVFFVTLMLVLLTETAGAVHLDFTISRLLCNLAGGVLALGAALLFWPSWERSRFPTAMAGALRASEIYLVAVSSAFANGRAFDAETLQAKRQAETANGMAAASLQRLAGEPARQQTNVDQGSALLHNNTRITRAITALTLHLQAGQPVANTSLSAMTAELHALLESLARCIETGESTLGEAQQRIDALDDITPDAGEPRVHLIHTQLAKISAELRAMLAALNSPN
ncbi:MAG: FUSC family protein, partial [Rariglobus sp.]